jgi:hypothetical protein
VESLQMNLLVGKTNFPWQNGLVLAQSNNVLFISLIVCSTDICEFQKYHVLFIEEMRGLEAFLVTLRSCGKSTVWNIL